MLDRTVEKGEMVTTGFLGGNRGNTGAGRVEEGARWRLRRYMVVIERDPTSWGVHVPDLPGCVAVGETRDEALCLIREAIELHIEALERGGIPVPMPTSEGELVEVSAA